jgi:limonene-1,2-epoxide hydrolase
LWIFRTSCRSHPERLRGTVSKRRLREPPVAAGPTAREVTSYDHPSMTSVEVCHMPSSAQTVQDFIAAFMNVWPAADPGPLGSFFDEDAIYHNIPLEPVTGRSAIVATFAEFMSMGGQVDVDIIHLVAEGPIVMTERVDHITKDDGTTVSFPMMGVIEVHGGFITAWRDYFDLGQFTSQVLGGS